MNLVKREQYYNPRLNKIREHNVKAKEKINKESLQKKINLLYYIYNTFKNYESNYGSYIYIRYMLTYILKVNLIRNM